MLIQGNMVCYLFFLFQNIKKKSVKSVGKNMKRPYNQNAASAGTTSEPLSPGVCKVMYNVIHIQENPRTVAFNRGVECFR